MKNILVNILLQVITAITGFILPPLIIKTFGSDMNGLVSSIGQFVAYLNIVEAGVGAASIAAMYKPLAEGNFIALNNILSATRQFYNKSGYIFISLIFFLAVVFPFIVSGQVDQTIAFLMVLVLGITGAAEFFLIGKYRVLLMADHKLYVISFAQIIGLVLSTASAVIFINTGFSILWVKFLSALIFLARYMIMAIYVRNHYNGINFKSKPDNEALSQRWDALVHQIAGLIVFNSPIILLTIFCGLKEVSVYSIYALVFSAVNQLLSSFSSGIQSFFGQSLVMNDQTQICRQYRKYEAAFYALIGWVYTCAIVLIMPFMSIYTKGMTDTNYSRPQLAILFATVGIANNLRGPGATLIIAAGHFKQTKYRSLLEAGINLAVSLVLVNIWGINGVLIGTLCSTLYRTIDVLIYVSKHFLGQSVLISTFDTVLLTLTIFISSFILLKFVPIISSNYNMWFYTSCYVGLSLIVPFGGYVLFKWGGKWRSSSVAC
ncbi:polysaccharide transport protein [Oryzomonas japonica]|uniref:Polysaccharide transport protein n=1 Tax=Oryzomonas japonica TaxID=2603858 RepID=A0A7J4ZQE7_9BACT|nr:polysaccharide transport protein [Oryzomonas japonica]KAB0665288.1 polysaccharide transport protein [Oryzomonas japonica]